MTRSYRSGPSRWWHSLSDRQVLLVTGCAVLGVWTQRAMPVVAVIVVGSWRRVPRAVLAVCAVVGVLGITLSGRAWHEVQPDRLGEFAGRACLVTDPASQNGTAAVVLEVEGERFQAWARGSPRRRLEPHLAGECARITATRRELTGSTGRRAAQRHIVGGIDLQTVGDWSPGTPLARASNRVRRLFAQGADAIDVPDDALFAGLVIGDDRAESLATITQFRAAGMSHLTAVSGQNVAFVIAAAGPILRRLRPWARWLATIGTIGWFVALTRFEPSVLRAGLMASLAATGYVLGREKPPARVLALAVGILVLIDPMLVWSVGFWLSVGATAGVALLSAPLAKVIPGPQWLSVPIGVTLGAQVGVAPVSLLVFGSLPLVSIPANLLAVPVAGFVMLYGLPAGLLAGAIGGAAATIVQIPSAIGTHWVAAVAALASHWSPPLAVTVGGWSMVAAFVVFRLRRMWQGDG